MYVIEIMEDKIDNLMEHITKSMRCLGKVADCLESMKHSSSEREDYDDDDEDEDEEYATTSRYGNRGSGRETQRKKYRGGGRYGRY